MNVNYFTSMCKGRIIKCVGLDIYEYLLLVTLRNTQYRNFGSSYRSSGEKQLSKGRYKSAYQYYEHLVS